MDFIHNDDNPLASPEEIKLIEEIKQRHAAEFEKRKLEGRDYPAFFGDIKLTRVLRGNDGDVNKAAEWYTNYIKLFNELDLDTMVAKLPDCTVDGVVELKGMPGCEVLEHLNLVWNAPKLTPKGDVICYMPLADFDTQTLVEKNLLESYKTWTIADILMRDLHMDHLSRKQGRVVKFIWIFDYTSVTMGKLHNNQFNNFDWKENWPLHTGLGCELIHMTVLLNPPGWVQRLWKAFKPFIPKRVKDRVRVLGADFATDRVLLPYVGSGQLAAFCATRKTKDNEDEEGSPETIISRGGALERTFAAQSSQQYQWEFEVKSGSRTGDFTMGPPSVEFSVLMFPDAASPEQEPAEGAEPLEVDREAMKKFAENPIEVITPVEPYMVTPEHGKIKGSYKPTLPGLLVIRWSNNFSWVRRKTVRFSISVTDDPAVSKSGGYAKDGDVPVASVEDKGEVIPPEIEQSTDESQQSNDDEGAASAETSSSEM
jgi:hypothetical protein